MAGPSDLPQIDAGSMAAMVTSILDDCIYNIVSDTVLKVHQEEKIARMQSAAIVAQQAKETAMEGASTDKEPQAITTAGAIITEEDKIFLRGNPLRTTAEILCPTCRLPRLLYPTTGKHSQPPAPGREYCAKQPYIEKDGCDIYGKSLQLEKPTKKSKAVVKDTKGKPESPNSDSDSPSNGKSSDKPAATSIPSGKCPNCPRYMAFTRIAQHMDRCLGLSGRQSSKNAMTKMTTSNTPRDSRATTPKPPPQVLKKRKLEKESDDDEDEGSSQKKKKVFTKKPNGTAPKDKAVNSNLTRVKGAEKRLPGQSGTESRDRSPAKDKDAKESASSKATSIKEDDESD